jgi:hypothetical protein
MVEVKLVGTGALASIYSDAAGSTPIVDNPFAADENGFARFYAAAGVYRISVSDDFTEQVYEDVELGTILSGVATATYTQLADQTNGINANNKYAHKIVLNSTDGRLYRAVGVLAVSPWISMDSRVVIVPGSDTGNVQTAAGTGTVNDYAINTYTRFLDVTPTGDVTYTGFGASYDGHEVIVTNRHATFLLIIAANNVGSDAAARVRMASDIALTADGAMRIQYSTGLSQWVATP